MSPGIGCTQFSNLYTVVDTPAKAAWLCVWCLCVCFSGLPPARPIPVPPWGENAPLCAMRLRGCRSVQCGRHLAARVHPWRAKLQRAQRFAPHTHSAGVR